MIGAEDIREHLREVLASHVFSSAARQQRLLRYLVERQLDGRAAELKEYSLGVEVFDRGDEFDPRLDPIVRVEASRLRGRLKKYYEGAGASSPVRIDLPRGAYVPAFLPREAPPESEAPAPPPAVSPRSRWILPGTAAGALVLAIAILLLRNQPADARAGYTSFTRLTSEEAQCTNPTFSPDGGTVIYARREGGHWDLYQRDIEGDEPRNLTADSPADDRQPAFSPDGSLVVFRSEREGGGLFLMKPDGAGVQKLTSEGFNPSWSPDSRQIVYSTETFSDASEDAVESRIVLRIVDVTSRQSRDLRSDSGVFNSFQPAWSPHGQRIAFWGRDSRGIRDLWTVAADGRSAPVPVTQDFWIDWSPVWSPDGRYLYFSSDRGGAMNLWAVRIDEATGIPAGKPEAVTTPSSYTGWGALSKDGQRFAYVRRSYSSKLCKAPLNHPSEITQLTTGARRVREPSMSPDGSLLAVRIQDPQEDIAIVKPDGSGLRRLTNDPYTDRVPRWSPDGSRIIFLSNRSGVFQLWSIRPDGSGLKQLTSATGIEAVWTPDGDLMGYPSSGDPFLIDKPQQAVPDHGLPPQFLPLQWSDDGKHAAGRLRSNPSLAESLFVYTPASRDLWQMTVTAVYPSLVWLHDNHRVLFSHRGGIYLGDLNTRRVHAVVERPSDYHSRFTLTPDEKTLYFVKSDDEEDIWIGRR